MEATVDDMPARPGRTLRLPAGAAYDRLTPSQRRAMVGAIVAAHVAVVWALLQVREVREAVADVAPIFISLVAPETPPKITPPPPPPPPTPPVRRPITPETRVITAAPSPAPAPFVAPPPPEPVLPEPAPVVVAAPVAPVAPPPAPAPPRNLSASSVQYLEQLPVEYPRLSKRLGETGVVMLRVFIDEAGRVREVQVSRTSGHPRLDDAAVTAVQKARFKPPTENGQAVSGYAQVPVDFQLEK
jgi:periplasmic protein TonB